MAVEPFAPPVGAGPPMADMTILRWYCLRDPNDASQDTLLEMLAAAYTDIIRDYCDRVFTDVFDGSRPFLLQPGQRVISLTPWELQTLRTVEDEELVALDVKTLEPASGSVPAGTYFSIRLEEPVLEETLVTVDGLWGVPTDSVPQLKLAVAIAVDSAYRNPAGHSSESLGPYSFSEITGGDPGASSQSLPQAARNILNPLRRWV